MRFDRLQSLLFDLSLTFTLHFARFQTINYLFQQGIAAWRVGRHAETEAIWRIVLKREAWNVTAYINLGIALVEQGNLEEAIASYRSAIQLDSREAVAYQNLGVTLQRQGNLEEAIANYRRAIQLNSSFTDAYINLGIALAEQGNLEEAITNCRLAVQIDPTNALAYSNLGMMLYIQGNLKEVLANCRRTLQLDPNIAHAYNNLGNALADQEQLEEAIASYRRAIQLDPNYVFAYANLGIVLVEQGNLEEAIANYRYALNLPDQQGILASAHTIAHNALGYALQLQGDLNAAIIAFQGAIELNFAFVAAQNNLREARRLLALQQNPIPVVTNDQHYLPTAQEEPLLPVLRATARIITHGSEGVMIGAGWIVRREEAVVWVVTNRRVISCSGTHLLSHQIEVEFFSNLDDICRPRYRATIEHTTDAGQEPDLAVVKVEGIPTDIQPLRVQMDSFSCNTPVRVIGHPVHTDAQWNTILGEVTHDNTKVLLPIDGSLVEGHSGGPVIDDTMQVVGMMGHIRMSRDIALDPNQPNPKIVMTSPRMRGVGLVYRMDVVITKLRE